VSEPIPVATPMKPHKIALVVVLLIFFAWLGFLTKIYFDQHAASHPLTPSVDTLAK